MTGPEFWGVVTPRLVDDLVRVPTEEEMAAWEADADDEEDE